MASNNFLLKMLFHNDNSNYDFELLAVTTIEEEKSNKLVRDNHHDDIVLPLEGHKLLVCHYFVEKPFIFFMFLSNKVLDELSTSFTY